MSTAAPSNITLPAPYLSRTALSAQAFALADGAASALPGLQNAFTKGDTVRLSPTPRSPAVFQIAASGSLGAVGQQLEVDAGAVLRPAAGQTLTVLATVIASPTVQVFDLSLGGAVLLTGNTDVHVGWFGAGFGGSNDAPAINGAIAATPDGGATWLQAETDYAVTGPIVQTGRVNFRGAGPTSRILVAASVGAGVDIFTIAPGPSVVLDELVTRDFGIFPASGTPGRNGLVVDTTADGSGVARHHIIGVTVFQLGAAGIKVVNLPAKADGWFTSSIEKCVLQGGMNLVNSGDSIRIQENVCVGNGWGIELQSIDLRDRPTSIKTSIATSASPVTYSGGALNGAIASTIMVPAQRATVTTSAHAATYNTGAPIVVHGTDASNNPVTDNLQPTLAGGGETIVGTQFFKTITSLVLPAQLGTGGAFEFGTSPSFPGYGSIVAIEENNITSLGGSVLVHSGDQVNLRNNNSEQFGTALGAAAIELRGDWGQIRAPSITNSFATAYGAGTSLDASMDGTTLPGSGSIHVASTSLFPSAGTIYVTTSDGHELVAYTSKDSTHFLGCTGGTGTMSTGGAVADKANVVNIDNCLSAYVAGSTLGRGIGGLTTINITANSQNAVIGKNVPGSILDYDVDFIHDAGVNSLYWGKYAVGVGGFDGTSVGQPSAGNAATMIANLGAGNNGTVAIEVSKNVVTQTFEWLPKTSDVGTNDIIITSQGPFAGATVTNRDSGAIVFKAPAPASGGVCRPWAIILDSQTRFQVGDSGASLSSQPGQTTTLGDLDNSDVIEISHASGLQLFNQAGVVSGVKSFDTLGPQGEVALTTDVTFAPSAVFFDLLTAVIVTVAGMLEIDFRICATVTVGTIGFRLVLDGTPIAAATGNIQAVGFSQSTTVLRHVAVTAGSHSVKVQYIAPTGSLNVSAATGNESASLFVRQS